jgi:hypothetical protein
LYNGVYLQGTLNNTTTPALSMTRMKHTMNMKAYEQSNHLGNVVVTVSDARQVLNSGSVVSGYMGIVKSASDYSSFGVTKAGRTSTSYRYGMNGQEKDLEIAEGIYTAEFWEYDSRITRRWNTDPIVKPNQSPYETFDSSPIRIRDIHGNTGENGTAPEQGCEEPNCGTENAAKDSPVLVHNEIGAPALPATMDLKRLSSDVIGVNPERVAAASATNFEVVADDGRTKLSYYFQATPTSDDPTAGYYVEVSSNLVDPNDIIDNSLFTSVTPAGSARIPNGQVNVSEPAIIFTTPGGNATLNNNSTGLSGLYGSQHATASRAQKLGNTYRQALSNGDNSNLTVSITFVNSASDVYRSNVISTLQGFGINAVDAGTMPAPAIANPETFQYSSTLTYQQTQFKPGVWVAW